MGHEDETLFQQPGPAKDWKTIRAIDACLADLSSAEQRAAKAVLDDPTAVIQGSVGQLADRAGTSSATVVRLARRLGFAGFSALKITLAHEAGQASAFGHPPVESDGPRSVLADVFRDEIAGLKDAEQSIDVAVFDQAVTALAGATEILFVGVGTSSHLAQLAAYRFQRPRHNNSVSCRRAYSTPQGRQS